jgi:hypothetical protein
MGEFFTMGDQLMSKKNRESRAKASAEATENPKTSNTQEPTAETAEGSEIAEKMEPTAVADTVLDSSQPSNADAQVAEADEIQEENKLELTPAVSSDADSNHGTARVAEQVPDEDRITLPVNRLHAALKCASKEESRYYLQGVHLKKVGDNEVDIVATDGAKMLVARTRVSDDVPDWLENGLTISSLGLSKRLALSDAFVTIGVTRGSQSVKIVTDNGDILRARVVDGAFPSYSRIIDGVGDLREDPERQPMDFDTIGFDGRYIKQLGEISKLVCNGEGGYGIRQYRGEEDSGAFMLFDFSGAAGVLFVLGQLRIDDKKFGAGAATVLEPALRGRVAALRAHRTRRLQDLETAPEAEKGHIQAKIVEYDRRIAVIEASGRMALEAPKAEAEPDQAAEDDIEAAEEGTAWAADEPDTREVDDDFDCVNAIAA